MKKIDIKVEKETGEITVDLNGEWDGACCGREAVRVHEELRKLGIELRLNRVACRLPIFERLAAKKEGECMARNLTLPEKINYLRPAKKRKVSV